MPRLKRARANQKRRAKELPGAFDTYLDCYPLYQYIEGKCDIIDRWRDEILSTEERDLIIEIYQAGLKALGNPSTLRNYWIGTRWEYQLPAVEKQVEHKAQVLAQALKY